MCGDPNCKYIELIEDEEGAKTAIHYGRNENDYYVLWTDYWQPESSESKQYKAHQWRPVNRTRKIRRNKRKTQKNLKNKVIKLGF
jgi:hypothetical protein